jgi:glycosyltransferase involved in cell wall biosynthesis
MAARKRVDYFVAISTEVQKRIRRIYGRDSVVIFPPVETDRFSLSDSRPEPFFLVASRLIPYKRIDLAIRAANRLGLSLVVVGEGRDRKKLEAIAGPTVKFLGRVSEEELSSLLRRCSAFIFPGLEDFGIAPVEAMASGRPVIAYRGGGALDTIVPGVTGEFFYPQTVDALAEVLSKFDPLAYNPMECRKQAEKFDVRVFRQQFMAFLDQVVGKEKV